MPRLNLCAPIRPSAPALYTAQQRAREKTFLADRGFPTAPFATAGTFDELWNGVARIGPPSVVKTAAFGAFVSLVPGKDGLVHISKLGNGKRIGKVEDVVKVGDKLRVEVADIDNRGKISLVPVREQDSADADPADATHTMYKALTQLRDEAHVPVRAGEPREPALTGR